ncbi:MAG: site-specific integrase [Alphaproteobacteria bacterium]|nr:site-specific integrase [Alphaproteobacteria bacterium]
MPVQKTNKVKLTKRVVESLTPDPSERVVLWDTEVTGFFIRVYPSGKKTYFLYYRNKKRETHIVKIGVHGQITTELAREQAIKLSLNIGAGGDPSVKVVVVQDNAHTMVELGEKYLSLHAKIKKKPQCYEEDNEFLKNVILKNFGTMEASSVSSFDIQNLHSKLKETPYRANRILALLSKMFNLAIKWGWRSDNPVRGIEKYQEYKRHRWLDNQEVQRLFSILETYHSRSVANAVRLLLLTGSRRNEVLSATWDCFDLEAGTWTKLAHTTKQKRMEYLPLSSQAISLLKEMKEDSTTNYLFPGKNPGKPLQDIKKAWHTIRTQAGLTDVRLHDLRHTHASHLVSSGLSLSIVGKLLGHTQASTTQRYAHLADSSLRQATEFFGNKLEKLTTRKPTN